MQTATTELPINIDSNCIYQGGYFTGIININGEQFGLIVAPKAEGEKEPTAWGEAGKSIEATSCFDGAANTRAMAEAGSDLAKWALELDINGHQDWYIPSRDELEIIYRNLKPLDHENCASFRDGDNASSVPPGYPYTETEPKQTSSALFQKDGAQAMEPEWYWSSTQYSAPNAWGQHFDTGDQFCVHKDYQGRARAVRRFKLIN